MSLLAGVGQGAVSPNVAPSVLARDVADALSHARTAAGLEISLLVREVLSQQAANPSTAAALREAVVAQLTPAQRGEFARAVTGLPLVQAALTQVGADIRAQALHNPAKLADIATQAFGHKLSSSAIATLIDGLAKGNAAEVKAIAIVTAETLGGVPGAHCVREGGLGLLSERLLGDSAALRAAAAQIVCAHIDANLPEGAAPAPRDSALFAIGVERGGIVSPTEVGMIESVASHGLIDHGDVVTSATLVMSPYFLWLLGGREQRVPSAAIERIWERLRVNRLACLEQKRGRITNRHGCPTPDSCDRYERECPAMIAYPDYSGCPLQEYAPTIAQLIDS